MNIAIWVLQGFLALAFTASGLMKLTRSREQLKANMPYVADFSDGQVRGIGAVEVLGALGVILPAWTGIAPVLTPIAATGLAIVMVLAALVHLRRQEYQPLPMNAVLFALAVFVAVMRFGPYAY